MPQCKNKKSATTLQLYGNGSKQSLILDVSISTRKRADKLNQIELSKLRTRTDYLDRNARYTTERQQRIVGNISKSLEILNAYHRLVSDEYRADNFDTLRWGYDAKEARRDPERFQRYIHETRIYNSGFSIRNLKREVNRKLEHLKPELNRQKRKEELIGRMKEMCVIEPFDRKQSMTMILHNFKQPSKSHSHRLPPIEHIEEHPA